MSRFVVGPSTRQTHGVGRNRAAVELEVECAQASAAIPNLRRMGNCSTLYYMKTAAVTIRLDPSLEEMLDRVCRDTGRSRSEVVREALRRQLTLDLLEEARRQLIPFAEAQGIYTDEDVFRLVS